MQISKILKINLRMFGFRYVFWDVFYQIFRRIYELTKKEIRKDKKISEKKINDYSMFIDENGKGIHRDLFLKGTREEVSVKIVKSLLKKGDVVLEAGANIGYYAILESKKIGDGGIVYAVEPIKENYELLKKNIVLNKLKNVNTYNLGFSDKDKQVGININKEGNLNTPLKIGEVERIEKVKGMTLDSFFKNKKKPNFMRMDIEGYEDVVFKGGDKTLDSLDKIFVELHFPLIKKEKMISLLKKLKEKKFEIYKAILEWERLEDETTLLGKFVNWLYKKKSRPVVFENLTIDKLIKSKDFLEGHLSLEVFFVRRRIHKKKENLN